MRQRRVTNFEQRLDKLQDDAAAQEAEERGIFELFDRDERGRQPEPEPDEDAPLQRDKGE